MSSARHSDYVARDAPLGVVRPVSLPRRVSPPIATGVAEIAVRLDALARRWSGSQARTVGLQRLSGGASQELWAFDVATPEATRELILRRLPGGSVKRDGATGMDSEARLIRLAEAAGAPVPEVVHVLAPRDGLGSGYIMVRVPGETLPRRLLHDPNYATARACMARQLGEAAARIHRINPAAAGPLRRTTAADDIAQARALHAAHGKPRPVVLWALDWLETYCPRDDIVPVVVHGDLRTGNIIAGPEGLRAVIDLELAHLGDPMEDLGWICVTSWRFGVVDRPAGGFGSREELFAGYEAIAGQRVDAARVRFWEVLGTLRWGLSCAVMAGEFLAGDRSVEKAAVGRRASETELDLLAMLAPRGRPHA